MKNPLAVKKGDRVRVVFEGPVTSTGRDGDWFDVGNHAVYPLEDAIQSIEVLKQPVRVGDEITGDVAYGLPVGSVVLYEPGGGASVKVADDAWARDPDEGYEPIYMPIWGTTPLRVLHLGRAA